MSENKEAIIKKSIQQKILSQVIAAGLDALLKRQ
jgi:hypothetical protein